MHPRNFGSGRIVRTEFVRPYVHPFMLADAKWHTWILFVENLVLDIPVLVSWQLQKKGVSADQCHVAASRAQVYNSSRRSNFFKIIRSPFFRFRLIAGSGPFLKGKI